MQQQLPSATFHFSAQAKKGADHTNAKLCLSQEWRGQSDIIIIHAVHTDRALLPSKPDRETCGDVTVRPQSLSSAVFSCNFTGEPIELETSSSWTPSGVCRG